MLKHFAAALIAASVIAAPAFAQTASPSTPSKPTAAASAATTKAAAPTKSVKKVKKAKKSAMKVSSKPGEAGLRAAPRTGTQG